MMGIFDMFRKKVKEREKTKERKIKSARNRQVSVQVQKKQRKETAASEKTLEETEVKSVPATAKIEPTFTDLASDIAQSSHEKTHQKLDNIDKKIDELLEIKGLYNDMLDWLVELARHSKTQRSGERVDVSAMVSDKSGELSILSPRLRQILDVVEERGEVIAEDVSGVVGLSLNRSSELLNALHRANYVEKNRAGRKVYYRKLQTPGQ